MVQTQEAQKKQEVQKTEGEKALEAQILQLQAEAETSKAKLLEVESKAVEVQEAAFAKAQAAKIAEDADIKKLFDNAQKEGTKKADTEDLTQAELLTVIGNSIDTVNSANAEQAKLDLATVTKASDSKLDRITNVLEGLVAKISVDAVREEHKDFEAIRPYMAKVNSKYPGMHPNDMYLLGKSWMPGDANASKTKTESEKPGGHMTNADDVSASVREATEDRTSQMGPQGKARSNRAQQVEGDQGKLHGVVQARDIISKGIDNVIDAREG